METGLRPTHCLSCHQDYIGAHRADGVCSLCGGKLDGSERPSTQGQIPPRRVALEIGSQQANAPPYPSMAPSIALILLAGLAEVIGFALVSSMKEGIRNPRGSLADFASFAGDLNEVAQLEGLRDIVAALLAICGVGLLIRALVLRRRARHRYAERAGRP